VRAILLALAVITAFHGTAAAQSDGIDTMTLDLYGPDSVYVRRVGSDLVVGWYPPPDSLATTVGSRDYRNWYTNDLDMSDPDFSGAYALSIDRTVNFARLTRDTVTVGVDTSIAMQLNTADLYDTYNQRINIGSNHYTPGEWIPIVLIGIETGDTLDFNVSISFSAGDIGVSILEDVAYFEIDFQTYDGFHVWRGLNPFPSDMQVLFGAARKEAYIGVDADSLYFAEWPKTDNQGRLYYEWTDQNAFVGFIYYYNVSCYDKGYFKGRFQHNKEDNFICDEDLDDPADPDNPVDCYDVAVEVEMTVSSGVDMTTIYAVPNPYRTGTSAETTPYYHNFPDMTVKFYNVPREGILRIYTVSGDLVWETDIYEPTGTDGVISWNTRNKSGNEVGSGVYIYKCERQDGDYMYGRLVIIR
jgi:hypothetical protein